jgi:hypothetical protein
VFILTALEVPWESPRGGVLVRWWRTWAAVSFRAGRFFEAARARDDALAACTFSMMTGAMLGVAITLSMVSLSVLSSALAWRLLALFGAQKLAVGLLSASITFSGGLGLALIITFALAGFTGPWVLGGVHHLILLLLDGTKLSYGHSVRVAAYAGGASIAWLMLPVIGWFVGFVFNVVHHVVGISATHRCGGGRAFVTWLLPHAACFCCWMGWLALAMASA